MGGLQWRADNTGPLRDHEEAIDRRALELLVRSRCDWVEAWGRAATEHAAVVESDQPEAGAASRGWWSRTVPGRMAPSQLLGRAAPAQPTSPAAQPVASSALPAMVMRSAERAEVDPAAAELVIRARRGGEPLDDTLRRMLEAALRTRLDGVRIHTDADAGVAARALGARAFAIGDDVFFREGAYDPWTRDGQQLIAHEVAHTVQARGAATTGGAMTVSQKEDAPERDADAFADAFVRRIAADPFDFRFESARNDGGARVDGAGGLGGDLADTVRRGVSGVGHQIHRQFVPEPIELPPEIGVPELPPEIGPEFDPEIEIEPGTGMDPEIAPEPIPEPVPAPEPAPAPAPVPEPMPGPMPMPQPGEPEEEEQDPECGSPSMPATHVTFSPGPLGQGGTVTAEPLTKCPGNTVGSLPSRSIFRDQFRCIAAAGQTAFWVRSHVLHGLTDRPGSIFNLHGPGNTMQNLIITDKSLNGNMYQTAELPAINRVWGNNEVLWYESRVDSYVPGLEYFAQSITVNFGTYNVATGTRGARLGGGTFALARTPPQCPAVQSTPGVVPATPNPPAPAGGIRSHFLFQSTLQVCKAELTSRSFHVSGGGLEVRIDARRGGAGGAGGAGGCPTGGFTIELEQQGALFGWNTLSSTPAPAGRIFTLRWRHLPVDNFRLRFRTPSGHGSCCLTGDIFVGTFSAPRPPPGRRGPLTA